MDQISLKTPTLNVGFSYKLTSKGPWRQVFICLRPPIPSPPRCYTLYEYIILYLFTQVGGEWGGELTREKVRGAMLHKAGRKYLKRASVREDLPAPVRPTMPTRCPPPMRRSSPRSTSSSPSRYLSRKKKI
jgi:hypothetical protein